MYPSSRRDDARMQNDFFMTIAGRVTFISFKIYILPSFEERVTLHVTCHTLNLVHHEYIYIYIFHLRICILNAHNTGTTLLYRDNTTRTLSYDIYLFFTSVRVVAHCRCIYLYMYVYNLESVAPSFAINLATLV